MSQFGTAGTSAENKLNGDIGLIIEHVPTCQAILFRRIKIGSFSDKLDTKWKEEEVFGRMDPITTYQATSRTISFSFDIGDDTIKNMQNALIGVSTLMKFQYPTYESSANALTLSRPPLLRVKFANYITDGKGGPLLCAMKGMSYDPVDNFDIGKNPRVVGSTLVPVRISVNMELRVLHESASRSFMDNSRVVLGKLTANSIGKNVPLAELEAETFEAVSNSVALRTNPDASQERIDAAHRLAAAESADHDTGDDRTTHEKYIDIPFINNMDF